ncbi:hypothetical protein [Neisseria brasiliensis]|uniref:hypothetical protein n=2 Tax=Neisseriaceae TaxID=481 RepID=UPI001E47044A|nr:hypothetical protein [Neisseria brasiliensis]
MMPLKSLACLCVAPLLSACAVSDGKPSQAERISVYKSDGSRQCGSGSGVSAQEMLRELDGMKVYAARADVLHGVAFPAVCGGGTPNINVYVIDAKNLKKAQQRGFHLLQNKGFGVF